MYTIRLATIDDLKNIQKLNTKAFNDNIKWDEDIVEDYASTEQGEKYYKENLLKEDGCFFVCESEGELVGYANGYDMNADWRKSRYFELANIGVLPEFRKKGVGNALLEKVTEWAKEHGFDKIYLNCYIKNRGALEFYRKRGYKDIDICLETDI